MWAMGTRENNPYLGDRVPGSTASMWVMGAREYSLYLGDGDKGEQPIFG